MKLIFCPKCQDVRKLHNNSRRSRTSCRCDQSYGWYEKDGLNAVIGGDAIPIGFDNPGFAVAIKAQAGSFPAFVIPEPCPTIKRV